MRIKELGDATGVGIETIRFYEKQGLLPDPARAANGYRDYEHRHLERLAFIRHCRSLDLGLPDIKGLLALIDTGHGANADVLVDNQLARVRARLNSMRSLERQLMQLRAACGDSHGGAQCAILKELVAAAHGEACVCHTA